MKKIWKLLSLLLIIAMLAGTVAVILTGCGKGEEAVEEEAFQLEVEGFQVGFCRVSINPPNSLPLTGYGNEAHRYFKNVLDNITSTAVAISDGKGSHYIWITSDLMTVDSTVVSVVNKSVSQKTGIPEDNILNSATHTHAAPTASRADLMGSIDYRNVLIEKQVEAAINALKDRKPAQMYAGSVETERLNFVRHLYHTTISGEKKYFGDNFGVHVFDDTTQMVHEPDPTLHLVRFVREGGKDVIITNFRGHSHFADGLNAYDLSGDCYASFREALEHHTGAHMAFFQGAAGNTNTRTNIPLLARTTDMRTFGNYLAEHAIDGLENNMYKVEDTTIKCTKVSFNADINHYGEEWYVQAQDIMRIWRETGDKADINHLLKQDGTGIRSPYQASAIIANFSRTKEKDGQIILRAISFGDQFAVCTYSGEMFEALSTEMEERSPFQTTMLFGYSDRSSGYLPSAVAYEYTCYETDITRFAAGTGEIVLEKLLEMLDELYEQE